MTNAIATVPALAGNVIGVGSQNFVIAEWRDAGGPGNQKRWIAPPHLHRVDDEAWYVLEGKLHIRVGPEVKEVGAGSALIVPRGTPHTYRNAGTEPVRYLLVMTPNIYSLIQSIHSATDRSPAALKALFQRHDSELIED